MALKKKTKPHDYLAAKNLRLTLTLVGRVFQSIGKPFYLIFIWTTLLSSLISQALVKIVVDLFVASLEDFGGFIITQTKFVLNTYKKIRLNLKLPTPKHLRIRINRVEKSIKFFLTKLSTLIARFVNTLLRIKRSGSSYFRRTSSFVASLYARANTPWFSRSLNKLSLQVNATVSRSRVLIINIFSQMKLHGLLRIMWYLLLLRGAKSLRSRNVFIRGRQVFLGFLRRRTKIFLVNVGSKISGFSLPTLPKGKIFVPALAFTSLLIGAMAISFWFYIIKDLPSPEELTERNVKVSTKIYDRNNILLYNIFKEENRSPVPLKEIPIHVRQATIATEDVKFYNHFGFSLKGIVRAIVRNVEKGELTGGSTITQQLVKNALLTPEKTLIRKVKEIVLAFRVELSFNKDEILEMYLNEVSYGGTSYGIQEASRTYFGKNVGELTLAEGALLAGLPKSPTRHSPFGPNPKLAFERQKEVLRQMYKNSMISEEQKAEAEKEEIIFADNRTDIKAPHFVMFIRNLLEEKFGKEVVENGGLEVITSLDYRIQNLAEQVVSSEVAKLSKLNVTNAGVIVIDPTSGEILAMVGSKDYFDTTNDGNVNVTTASRQPGSSIKVINYAYALSSGFTAATILEDAPHTFFVEGQPPYSPRNYDNQFRGYLPLRSALAESRNLPAVKVLEKNGVKNMINLGKKMGITTWENHEDYGLSLTLGGGEVKLIDLATVYATLANYGKRPNQVVMLKVTNYESKVLEKFECNHATPTPQIAKIRKFDISVRASENEMVATEAITTHCNFEQVVDPRVSYIITDILKDNKARAPQFGNNSLLVIPKHKEVAVKTGTSNDLRDNLAIGYNQKYVVAVWVGNNDNSQMSRIASGITGATPIFNKIMSTLLANEENHGWSVPEGLIKIPVCSYTGTLPCEGCPTRLEWFLEETMPEKACSPKLIQEILDKQNEEGKKENKKDVSEFFRFEVSNEIRKKRER